MGVSADNGPSELDVIAQGGANFTARMDSFYAAKTAMEEAVAAFNFGKAAKDAFDEATDARAKAKDVLDKAKAKAAEIIANAQQTADELTTKAQDGINARVNALQVQEADLKARTAAFDQQVADATAEAKASAAESKKATAELKKATAAAEKAQADADAEKLAALEARKKYEDAYANLMNSIQAVRVE